MKAIEKLTILAIAFLSLIATAAIAPALSGIQAHFSTAPTTLVKLVITLPALICIPIGFLNSTFIKFISKKNLIIIGLILYLVGGTLSFFSTNIYILLGTRIILGLGLGITAPLSLVLIGDFFHGKERAKFMGYSTASTNLGGILSTLVVGFLSSLGWKYSFLIYLLAIFVIILVALFLPKSPNETTNTDIEKTNLHNVQKQIPLNRGIIKYAIIILLALIAFYGIPTNLDFLVTFKNIGTEKTAADIVSIATLASLLSALVFGKLIKIFKSYYSIIIFVLMAIGCFLMGYGDSFNIVLIGSILNGLGFGGIVPFTMLFAANIVHKTHTALSIIIVTSSLYLGEFISPLILEPLANIIGIHNVTGNFFGASIICLIALLVSIYAIISDKNLAI